MKIWNFLKRNVLVRHLVLAGILVLLLLMGVARWLNSTTNHGDFIEVPDFAQKSVIDVERMAADANLRIKIVDSANYNPKFPRFSITEQNPEAGTHVKKNRMIYVKVNPSNYKKVSVPNVIQVTKRNAVAKLKAVGLIVDKITYKDFVGKDMVFYIKYKGKNIGEGDRIPKMSKVELVCGNGNRGTTEDIDIDHGGE
ncbi:MAG: PASTA domain-containing protein [Flavobacteriaceae bacterium]|nr:PASTA domain-containing protein [Flavobacteriaceae bacterium]